MAERLRCSVLDLDEVDTILYWQTLTAIQVEQDLQEHPHKQVVETIN